MKEAVEYLEANGIALGGINMWEGALPVDRVSPKIFADYYIDDKAVGAPLIYPKGRPAYLNWEKVMENWT